MFRRLLRKMINNKRMVTCLLTGLILAVAMISSVPIYTEGVLQRMLTKDLESYQVSSGRYPGTYEYDEKLYNLDKDDALKRFNAVNNKIDKELVNEPGLPIVTSNLRITIDFLTAVAENEDTSEKKKKRALKVEGISGLEDHIKIIQGNMPSDKKNGDVYEVMVTEDAIQSQDLLLGKTYIINSILSEDKKSNKVKIVGVFAPKEAKDLYWLDGRLGTNESFIMNNSLFMNEYIKEDAVSISNTQWYYAFDYHKIKVSNLKDLVDMLQIHAKILGANSRDLMSAMPIFKKYDERAKLLKTTLWVLQVPILLMIIFYLFMVSQLIIEQDKNEIAVLKSRGASRKQIINGYILQGIVLSVLALIIGPPVGLLLCQVLGAANGFMEFVSRTRLVLSLNPKAYLYSLVGVFVFILTMFIPALSATKTTIVVLKQKKARSKNTTLWKKYFLDLLLLGISIYGLYTYRTRQNILKITGVSGSDIPMDPLLFLISTLFIIALGMLFLRIFPYIVLFIFQIGKRFWGPVGYSSLLNASRSGGKDQFIILFLILTISIGIFNANAARTINTNVEEKVKYTTGTDINLTAKWENDQVDSSSGITGAPQQAEVVSKPVTYIEPPFGTFTQIKGVDLATKVFRKNGAVVQVGNKSYGNTYVMGIESYEFGKTIWFRNKLLPFHINQYLNVLAKNQTAFIVSTSFKTKYKSKLGDPLYVKWGENNYLQGYIYAFVDYWPSYNPYEKGPNGQPQDLIVANLSYIQAMMKNEPYEVWIKTKEGSTSKEIYQDIEDKKIPVVSIKDTKQEIITKKNDPMLQGTNGALTMGFIVTMIICTIGFLIYWILSIERRTLQFGILRAMGLPLKKVIGILACEQVIISGTSILVGVLVGGLTSDLFIPLLQIVYGSSDQVPPFKVAAFRGDYIKLYMIILIMLIFGFTILGRLISKIKINQAVKLGED